MRAASVQVDPERVLLLDLNYTNNSATLAPRAAGGRQQMVARLADLAAGSAAHLRVLHLGIDAWRSLARVSRRRPAGQRCAAACSRARCAHDAARSALPLSLALRGMIAAHSGASLAADTAGGGRQLRLVAGVLAQATGLGTTFVPSIIGFGAVLENISSARSTTSRWPRRSPASRPPGW